MPLFIYSLLYFPLDRNGLKFGYGPSMLMISDEIAVTRVTLSDCRAEWFRLVMAESREMLRAGQPTTAPGARRYLSRETGSRPIAAQP
jgi:hypothetical protein